MGRRCLSCMDIRNVIYTFAYAYVFCTFTSYKWLRLWDCRMISTICLPLSKPKFNFSFFRFLSMIFGFCLMSRWVMTKDILIFSSLKWLRLGSRWLGEHYRSKTHFCNNNYPFQQKYINLSIRNIVEVIKRIFWQKWRNLKKFWNQWDPNPRTSKSGQKL